MQVVDVNGNMFGYDHLEIIGVDGKPKTTGGGGGGGSITIGTTTISSGTVGRILFEGTGNVVQESANLNFDISTNNFIIGTTATSSPKLLITSLNRSDILLRSGAATNDTLSIYAFGGTYGSNYAQIGVNDGVNAANQGGAIYLDSRTGTAPPIRLTVKGTGTTAMTNAMSVFNTGNVAINTIIDSGYKLDVNGTFKVSGAIYDSTNSPGTSGQVLSSTVTGTAWVSAGGGGASIIKLSAQTLTAASWSLSGGYYISTFSNVNITTNTRVDFTPDNSAYSEVTTCGMLPEVDVFAGSCRFYSLFPPQSDILGEITIFPTI
jgi:hypothetical protein